MGVGEVPRQRAAALGNEAGAAPFLQRGISHSLGKFVAPEQGLQGRQDLALRGHARMMLPSVGARLFNPAHLAAALWH